MNVVYLPFAKRGWKESTAGTSEQIIKSHLLPELGKTLLHAFRRDGLQDHLDLKARTLSSSVVSHLRWFLNGIFNLAVSDGVVLSNPAAELKIPRKCQPGREMRPLTEEEVMEALELFDLREKLIFRLAIFEGLRPGEILALRWKSLEGDVIWVKERVYKRVLNTPKNGKVRDGAISDGTLALIKEWAELAEDSSPEAFVFPSEKLTTPLSLRQSLAQVHGTKAGESGYGVGHVSGSQEDKRELGQEGRRRSQSSLRAEGPRTRRQLGGVYEFRFGTEARSSQETRSRGASKTETSRTSFRPGLTA